MVSLGGGVDTLKCFLNNKAASETIKHNDMSWHFTLNSHDKFCRIYWYYKSNTNNTRVHLSCQNSDWTRHTSGLCRYIWGLYIGTHRNMNLNTHIIHHTQSAVTECSSKLTSSCSLASNHLIGICCLWVFHNYQHFRTIQTTQQCDWLTFAIYVTFKKMEVKTPNYRYHSLLQSKYWQSQKFYLPYC